MDLEINTMKCRGYTLFELLIIIAIIGILAAILLPGLARAREAGRRASCYTSLHNFGMAMHMYAQENKRELPWSGGNGDASFLNQFKRDYLPTINSYYCSSDPGLTGRSEDPNIKSNTLLDSDGGLRTSYDFFGAYTDIPLTLPEAERPTPKIPLMWDIVGLHQGITGQDLALYRRKGLIEHFHKSVNTNHVPGGGNVLWMDGSVTFVPIHDWPRVNLPFIPANISYFPPDSPFVGQENNDQ